MVKAVWKGKVIAESDKTEIVEKNHYFPPESIKKEFFRPSGKGTTYQCAWKGMAKYYDIVVDGNVNEDAAWYYPEPSEKAKNIKNYVSFWKGVEIVE